MEKRKREKEKNGPSEWESERGRERERERLVLMTDGVIGFSNVIWSQIKWLNILFLLTFLEIGVCVCVCEREREREKMPSLISSFIFISEKL